MISKLVTQDIDVDFLHKNMKIIFFFFKKRKRNKSKQSQINPLCSTQLSLSQGNNMVNLCICSMQVHQSRVILSGPIAILSGCFLMLAGLCASVRGWQTALPSVRFRSWPRCCSSPPSSGPGRGTCTCLHPGTGTCTQWPRRARCCVVLQGDRRIKISRMRLVCG